MVKYMYLPYVYICVCVQLAHKESIYICFDKPMNVFKQGRDVVGKEEEARKTLEI